MSKAQEIVTLVLMAASFGLGYGFRNAQKTTTNDQVTEVKDSHTVVVTVTHKETDGDIKVTRTIDADTKIKTDEIKQVQVSAPIATKLTSISALAGYDFSHPGSLTPIYGVSVTRQVLGPVTVGAYGMTNGVIGVSLGVTF